MEKSTGGQARAKRPGSRLGSHGNTIFKMLKDDHRHIRKLCERIVQSDPGSLEVHEWFDGLNETILEHTVAEKAAFYDRLIGMAEFSERVQQCLAEHHCISLIINDLADLSVHNEGWMPRMKFLTYILERHIEFEESRIFKDAAKKLETLTIEKMYEDYRPAPEQQPKRVAHH